MGWDIAYMSKKEADALAGRIQKTHKHIFDEVEVKGRGEKFRVGKNTTYSMGYVVEVTDMEGETYVVQDRLEWGWWELVYRVHTDPKIGGERGIDKLSTKKLRHVIMESGNGTGKDR